MKKAIVYGILSSLFFAVTFVLNRSMDIAGGSYLWSASLRFIFMLPMLYLIVRPKGAALVHTAIRQSPRLWILWSIVGFGLFYFPLTFASTYGPSWFIAGAWQITIVAGVLLTPLFGRKIPLRNLALSCIILIGVFLLSVDHATEIQIHQIVICMAAIIVAAFAYPLGNRKMMELCQASINAPQRVYGMTLCSMPLWVFLGLIAIWQSGLPDVGQVLQTFLVAVFSGIVATILFFKATDLVRENVKQLAVIEATQAGEVVFALLGGILWLGDSVPATMGVFGLVLIIAGMVVNSLYSR